MTSVGLLLTPTPKKKCLLIIVFAAIARLLTYFAVCYFARQQLWHKEDAFDHMLVAV